MEVILKYFPNLSKTQTKQFSQLQELYSDWNSKINVISRKDVENLYLKHVLHSLAIAKVIQFNKGTKILDVGTGGGFPGIPLAILFPDVEFLLVDSIGKKINVVNEVSSRIDLHNLNSENSRVECIVGSFDFIVSRAVARMDVFYNWVSQRISKKQKNSLSNGVLYLKGGDLTEELRGIRNVRIFDIATYFDEDFFLTKKVVYIGHQ